MTCKEVFTRARKVNYFFQGSNFKGNFMCTPPTSVFDVSTFHLGYFTNNWISMVRWQIKPNFLLLLSFKKVAGLRANLDLDGLRRDSLEMFKNA